ncbi:hypothetical protein OUK_0225 [Helicobacter pylori R037c]|nr:hypothetical protein OUK_0225 [Helicobacter pylori R037c]
MTKQRQTVSITHKKMTLKSKKYRKLHLLKKQKQKYYNQK